MGPHPTESSMHMTFEKMPKHVAPIDCVSAKGMRCDICFEPMPELKEHPAARAAKMIKQLHLDTIAKADAGFVFEKEGKDVTFEVVDACHKQIDLCDGIIARADSMPVSLSGEAFMILKDLQDVVDSKKEMKVVPDEQLPEIGNYDHKKVE